MDLQTIGIIVGIVAAAVGTVVGVWTLWLALRSKPKETADNSSLSAGGDVGAAATGAGSAAASQGSMAAARDIIINREGMTEEERARLKRVEESLAELQGQMAAPPPGSQPVETEVLAVQATDRTEELLAEAVQLQAQNKEQDAIERLLTAYDMDMPSVAKAQLHLLAGTSFLNLSELEEAEGHYRQALDASREANHRGGQAAALGNRRMSAQ